MNTIKEINRINERELQLGVKGSWHDQYRDSAYIFMGGLPYDLTEGDVIAIFSQWGEVIDINLPRAKDTGKQRGFGFLMYEDQRSTVLAVDNMNGAQVRGRTLRVDHCRKYEQKGQKNEEGEYVAPEEPTYNAMPPTIEASSGSESESEEDQDDLDEEDPMAAHIRAEKKKAKAEQKRITAGSSSGDRKRKREGEGGSKEERKARKEERRLKREARERKKLTKGKDKESVKSEKYEDDDDEPYENSRKNKDTRPSFSDEDRGRGSKYRDEDSNGHRRDRSDSREAKSSRKPSEHRGLGQSPIRSERDREREVGNQRYGSKYEDRYNGNGNSRSKRSPSPDSVHIGRRDMERTRRDERDYDRRDTKSSRQDRRKDEDRYSNGRERSGHDDHGRDLDRPGDRRDKDRHYDRYDRR